MAFLDLFRRSAPPAPVVVEVESRANSIEDPRVPLSAANIFDYLGWSQTGAAAHGIAVTPESAMTVPAMFCAVNFIADSVASLPFNVYRKPRGKAAAVAESDPLNWILGSAPNPETTSYDWRKLLMTRTLVRGRSYSYIERAANGKVANLWGLETSRTKPKIVDGRKVYEYRRAAGDVVTYSADEILDLVFMLEDDGVSYVEPYRRLGEAIGLGIALQKYASRVFNNGGVPPMQLVGPFTAPGAIDRASTEMSKAVETAGNQGRSVLAVPNGHELKEMGMKLSESQLLEARSQVVLEVARIYNLSPIFLQDLTNGTFANTEQQDLQFAKHTLTHWLEAFEQECDLKLFRNARGLRFAKFDPDGLLRGDFKSRTEGWSKMVQNAILTPNEVREEINRETKEGGDSLMIQQNMSALGQLGGGAANDD